MCLRPCLASESVGHPDILDDLGLVVPQLVAIGAVDLGHDELDVLGHQLALLPGHRFTSLVACPHLQVVAFKTQFCGREQECLEMRSSKELCHMIILVCVLHLLHELP